MRQLYTVTEKCPIGCLYCFHEHSANYLCQLNGSALKRDIVYPCCDGEGLLSNDFLDKLAIFSENLQGYSIISISSKAALSNIQLNTLRKIDQAMKECNRGSIKFAVSFTNMSMIKELEPHSASVDSRIQILKFAKSIGLYTSVTIKPILPFTNVSEYYKLIDLTKEVTDSYLLGGLYVFKNGYFFNKYIKNKFETSPRKVTWLPNNPLWDYVEDQTKTSMIKQYITSIGCKVYSSDVDLITENFISERQK